MTKPLFVLVAVAAMATGIASHAAEPGAAVAPAMAASAAAPMTEGEVRKIDLENHKVTLKHGEITNLGMPGMTMVFQVQDPSALASLKAGDKVRFTADRKNGALVVTHIEIAR